MNDETLEVPSLKGSQRLLQKINFIESIPDCLGVTQITNNTAHFLNNFRC